MSLGLVGRKCGMTRVFGEDGASIPVTVLQIDSNRIAQVKTIENDGYRSVQVAVGEKKSSKINKAMAGHYAAANMTARTVFNRSGYFDQSVNVFRLAKQHRIICNGVLILKD